MKLPFASVTLSAALLLAGWVPVHAELALDSGVVNAAPAPSIPSAASVGPMLFISQTLNNCGPSSVAEVLDFYGIHRSQGQVQAVLRADGNPGGMSPFGIPAYVRGLGMASLMGAGGSDLLVKTLVANGFPVIVSQWVSLGDHYGHYRPIQSYDDSRGVFVSSDPYLGPGHAIGYDEFDKIWASSNNRFYVIYPPQRKAQLMTLLSSTGWDQTAALQADIAIQQERMNGGIDGPQGWGFRRGYSALSMAWDYLQLGDAGASQRALDFAGNHGASPVVIGWIAGELKLRQQAAPGAGATAS